MGLQRKDRELVLHGHETGRIVRFDNGEYIEVHEPLTDEERWVLVSYQNLKPRELAPEHNEHGVRRKGYRWDRFKAALSRFYYEDRVEPVTPAELAAAQHHGHGAEELDSDGHAEATEAVNMAGSIAKNLYGYQQSRGLSAADATTALNNAFASPKNTPAAPDGGTTNLDTLIPQIQLPPDHPFNYKVTATTGTSGDGNGSLVFCILAAKIGEATNTVLYSSHSSADPTWNRNYSTQAYVTEGDQTHAAGGYCDTAGAVTAAFST
mgnify:CR=1 FL=1